MRNFWLDRSGEEIFKELDSKEVYFLLKADAINNTDNLLPIGDIASYTQKGCTGYLVFNHSEAQEALENNIPFIYYYSLKEFKSGIERLDCDKYLRYSVGVIMKKEEVCPHIKGQLHCAIYEGALYDDEKEKMQKSKDRWVSISPKDGYIFSGIQNFCQQKPMDNLCLKNLYVFLKSYVLSKPKERDIIKAWDFLDIILDRKVSEKLFQKENIKIKNQFYPCYYFPNDELIYFNELSFISDEYDEIYIDDLKLMIIGIIMSIRRMMGQKVPLRQHGKFFRPLFDPMEYITMEVNRVIMDNVHFVQFNGIEFFDLSKYSEKYQGLDNIKIFFKTDVNIRGYHLNFLDYTNPNGADIILNAFPHDNILIYANEKKIEKEDIFSFYNSVRIKELF